MNYSYASTLQNQAIYNVSINIENNLVTIRGYIEDSVGTEISILVKKPDANGNSQNNVELSSINDGNIIEIIDYMTQYPITEAKGSGVIFN
jgi:hypothetical protein